jgi:hypothetical protein
MSPVSPTTIQKTNHPVVRRITMSLPFNLYCRRTALDHEFQSHKVQRVGRKRERTCPRHFCQCRRLGLTDWSGHIDLEDLCDLWQLVHQHQHPTGSDIERERLSSSRHKLSFEEIWLHLVCNSPYEWYPLGTLLITWRYGPMPFRLCHFISLFPSCSYPGTLEEDRDAFTKERSSVDSELGRVTEQRLRAQSSRRRGSVNQKQDISPPKG